MNDLLRVSSRLRRLCVKLPLAALLLCVLALIPSGLHAQTNSLTALLQQGLFEEQANRNLDAAIADYQALARQFDKDRQLVATAVFRLGECYRMQGKTNEASLEYQRILRDFSDQTTLATLSRQNLTGMGMSPAPTASARASSADQEAIRSHLVELEANYTNQQIQLARLKTLTAGQPAQELPSVVADSLLNGLLSQLSAAKEKLAVLKQDYGSNHPDVLKTKALIDEINGQIRDRETGILASLESQLNGRKAEIAKLQDALGTASSTSGNSLSAGQPSPDSVEAQEIQRIQTMIQNSPDLINGDSLWRAANAGQLRVATFLLDHGANINATSGRETPLISAAKNAQKTMVELLLSRGADVNARSSNGGTALLVATEGGYQAVVEVLLAHKAEVNEAFTKMNNEETPLHKAAERGFANLVSLLLTNGADANVVNDDGRTPLHQAAKGGQGKIVQILLDAGAKANMEDRIGRTPLSYAAESGSPEMVKMLLAAKADPNGGKLDAPLPCAIYNDNIESAELLLQAGAKPDSIGEFDFSRQPGSSGGFGGRFGGSIGGGGGPVSGRGGRGGFGGSPRSVTPLWLAISENQLPMVQLILKFKADLNGSQPDGSPLIFTALSRLDILAALLDAGADPNRPNKNVPNSPVWQGESPLMSAVGNSFYETFEGNSAAAKLLLAHGANPNATSPDGNTVLHWAIGMVFFEKWQNDPTRFELVKLLLDYHANPNVRNKNGQTPLDLLKSRLASGDTEAEQKTLAGQLVDLLRQHGALDNLPDWGRITVSRPAANFSAEIFRKGTNDWNQFTLLQLIYRDCGLYGQQMPFPDLTHIVVVRPGASGAAEKRIEINLLNSTNGVDCAKDVPLEFGDVVEIPERGHTLAQQDNWFRDQRQTLDNYFRDKAGEARLIVAGGQTVQVPLSNFLSTETYIGDALKSSAAQNILTSTSDLSRVKVTRRDLRTKRTSEWILDCSRMNGNPPLYNAPNLLLRGGDVIEVPAKP